MKFTTGKSKPGGLLCSSVETSLGLRRRKRVGCDKIDNELSCKRAQGNITGRDEYDLGHQHMVKCSLVKHPRVQRLSFRPLHVNARNMLHIRVRPSETHSHTIASECHRLWNNNSIMMHRTHIALRPSGSTFIIGQFFGKQFPKEHKRGSSRPDVKWCIFRRIYPVCLVYSAFLRPLRRMVCKLVASNDAADTTDDHHHHHQT